MGLEVSHDAWTGSYGAFSAWRAALAGTAGYEVTADRDENGRISVSELMDARYGVADWQITPERLDGEWNGEEPADPLLVLLLHADHTGYIHPGQALPLAERLEQLRPRLAGFTGDAGDEMNFELATRLFAEGLRRAAEYGESLVFH